MGHTLKLKLACHSRVEGTSTLISQLITTQILLTGKNWPEPVMSQVLENQTYPLIK